MRIIAQDSFNNPKYKQTTQTYKHNDKDLPVYTKQVKGCRRIRVFVKALAQIIFTCGAARKSQTWQQRWHAARNGVKEIALDFPLKELSHSKPINGTTTADAQPATPAAVSGSNPDNPLADRLFDPNSTNNFEREYHRELKTLDKKSYKTLTSLLGALVAAYDRPRPTSGDWYHISEKDGTVNVEVYATDSLLLPNTSDPIVLTYPAFLQILKKYFLQIQGIEPYRTVFSNKSINLSFKSQNAVTDDTVSPTSQAATTQTVDLNTAVDPTPTGAKGAILATTSPASSAVTQVTPTSPTVAGAQSSLLEYCDDDDSLTDYVKGLKEKDCQKLLDVYKEICEKLETIKAVTGGQKFTIIWHPIKRYWLVQFNDGFLDKLPQIAGNQPHATHDMVSKICINYLYTHLKNKKGIEYLYDNNGPQSSWKHYVSVFK